MLQGILMPQEFSCVDHFVDIKIILGLLREYLTSLPEEVLNSFLLMLFHEKICIRIIFLPFLNSFSTLITTFRVIGYHENTNTKPL